MRKVATSIWPAVARAEHGDHAERGADRQRAAVAEEVANLVGRGAGGDVVIFGRRGRAARRGRSRRPTALRSRRRGASATISRAKSRWRAGWGMEERCQRFRVRARSSDVESIALSIASLTSSIARWRAASFQGNDVFDAGAEEVEDEFGGRLAEGAFGGHGVDVAVAFRIVGLSRATSAAVTSLVL